MMRSDLIKTKSNLLLIVIYLLANSLFVWKYATGLFSPIMATLLYLCLMTVIIVFLFRDFRQFHLSVNTDYVYTMVLIVLAIGLVIIMKQFDPTQVSVGRYPALHGWLERLFDGEYPYVAHIRPSGFPFLFILATPFYLLGDIGLMQVFAFLLFGWILFERCRTGSPNKYYIIFLLVFSPLFLFEIVTRSELFSNIVFVLFYLHLFEKYASRSGSAMSIILGLSAGFLLSTRGIVLLIFIIFFGYYYKKRAVNRALFLFSSITGFLLTIVPFAIWNWDSFWHQGPFAVQLLYIPSWALGLSLATAHLLGRLVKSKNKIYPFISYLLFGVVLLAMTLYAIQFGWYDTILGSKFDISYFCFALPFILMSLAHPFENTE